jgi:hypothetical protein
MRYLIRTSKRRFIPLLGAFALLMGGIGASAMSTARTADAAACVTGTNCTITGTLAMTGGALTLTAPSALGWSETVNGLDQTYQVNDSRGTAPGWHVTVAATTFTSAVGAHTLADSTTFATNGSITSMTNTTAPTATCLTGSTCTLPTDTTAYPVPIITGSAVTPLTIYNAGLLTGTGTITIGVPGAAPVGWWLNVPSNTIVGTYTSTITLAVTTAP